MKMAERVDVAIQEPVAATAYAMARDLWMKTHRDTPSLESSLDFLVLVANCALALTGKKPYIVNKD
jgi:hypothetical protein